MRQLLHYDAVITLTGNYYMISCNNILTAFSIRIEFLFNEYSYSSRYSIFDSLFDSIIDLIFDSIFDSIFDIRFVFEIPRIF